MNRREFLATMALAGVSGCLRLQAESTQTGRPGSSTDARTPTESSSTATVSEAASPTETTATGPAPYPTGLDDDGPNLFLVPTHVRTLKSTSYRAVWRKLNHTKSEIYQDREYRNEGGKLLGTVLGNDSSTVEVFRSGDDAYWRENLGGSYTYGNDRHRNEKMYEWTLWARELNALIEAGAWGSPEVVQESPTTVWRVQTDSLGTESVADRDTGGTITGFTAGEMKIDENGVIRSLNAKYEEVEDDEGSRAIETTYTIDAIGATTVAEPSWLTTAKEQAPTVAVSITEDDSFVKLRIESGGAIASGSVLQVFDRAKGGSPIDLMLDEPLEPGTTAYLYDHGDGDSFPSGTLVRGSRPTAEPAQKLPNSYDVWARRRDIHYFKTYEVQS
ncbi:hypothetical protein [Haloarchaeobius sp. DT45]|uniref:hypothetical protein n=1 Tax=Haloarchaeobius sp. DT45 TaxID=3446116 RepID=UPI003F6A75EE